MITSQQKIAIKRRFSASYCWRYRRKKGEWRLSNHAEFASSVIPLTSMKKKRRRNGSKSACVVRFLCIQWFGLIVSTTSRSPRGHPPGARTEVLLRWSDVLIVERLKSNKFDIHVLHFSTTASYLERSLALGLHCTPVSWIIHPKESRE